MTRLARAQVPEPGGQEQDAGADQVAGPPVENPVRHHWYAWKVALVLPSQPTTEPMVTRRRSHVPAAERAVMNVTVAVASESGMCCCAFSPARRAGARPSSAEACGPAGRDVEDLVSSGSTLNLLIELVMKNLPVGDSRVVQIVTFTPKPRFVKMLLTPTAEDPMKVNDAAVIATRFLIRPQLGLFASLLVIDIPDVKCWILGGEAPAFLRFEGPLYFMGPIWRIDWS